jgi:hypothetical protein
MTMGFLTADEGEALEIFTASKSWAKATAKRKRQDDRIAEITGQLLSPSAELASYQKGYHKT